MTQGRVTRSQVESSAGWRCALARWRIALLIALGAPGASQLLAADGGLDPAQFRLDIAKRRSFVAAAYGQASGVRTHPKWYPYFVLARTKLRGCDPKLAEYMAGVLDQTEPVAGSSGLSEPELFSEPPLVRFVYLHRDCLSQAQQARIARALERPRHLFGHGTINMAAIRTTSIYLMAQAFPEAIWTDHDGTRYASADLRAKLQALMVRRYARFLQDGEAEQLSPSYAATNFFTALNLVEFAEDPELKAFAEAYAVQSLTLLRLSSLQGVILAPIYRQNAQQRSGPAQVGLPCVSPSQHVLWLYFGEPEIGTRDLESGCEPTYVSMLADSDWVPPAVIASAPDPAAPAAEHTIAVPDFSLWDAKPKPFLSGRVYRSRNFAIGSGNSVFDPDGYHTADNTFMLAWRKPKAEFNYIECFHPYWTSNVGPDAWSTIRVPPTFYPNTTSRSSPFQQSFFDRGRGVLLFSIPEADPWPFSREPRFFAARDRQKDRLFARQNCHFPKSVDEWRQDGSWLFIRAGETYVGIEAVGLRPTLNDIANDPTVLGFVKLTTEANHAALFFVAEEASRRHRSFKAFQEHARSIARRYDPERDEFSFAGEDGTMNKVVFRLEHEPGTGRVRSLPSVTRNGRAVVMQAEAIMSGPNYQIGQGRLYVQTRHGSLDVTLQAAGRPEIRERVGQGAGP